MNENVWHFTSMQSLLENDLSLPTNQHLQLHVTIQNNYILFSATYNVAMQM